RATLSPYTTLFRSEGGGRGEDREHRLLGEEREDQTDEHPEPQPRQQAAGGHLAGREPAGHPLDLLEVGADDEHVLHREVVVGEVIDDPLGGRVVVVDAQGLRELQPQGVLQVRQVLRVHRASVPERDTMRVWRRTFLRGWRSTAACWSATTDRRWRAQRCATRSRRPCGGAPPCTWSGRS